MTFTYDFNVTDQSGTYWYHSHMGSQYGDGLRGLFIIEYDNDDEYNKEFPYEYDEDVTLSVEIIIIWNHQKLLKFHDKI